MAVSDDVETEREEQSMAIAAAEFLHLDVLESRVLSADVAQLPNTGVIESEASLMVVYVVVTVTVTVFVIVIVRLWLMEGETRFVLGVELLGRRTV